MGRNYIKNPPVFFGNMPDFLLVRFIKALIVWSKEEYANVLSFYSSSTSMKKRLIGRKIMEEYTNEHILAQTHAFSLLTTVMRESVWWKLSKSDRDMLANAYEIFQYAKEQRENERILRLRKEHYERMKNRKPRVVGAFV